VPADAGADGVNILVWQWGRLGAGPRFAALLAEGLAAVPGVAVTLSLASGAEILTCAPAPRCDLPVATYAGIAGYLRRAATAPFAVAGLARRIAALRPDIAVCAMTGPLDLLMAAALARLGIPFVVLVHDADVHPGDGMPLQMPLQRALCRRAAALAALSAHVGERLLQQRLAGVRLRPLLRLAHPPMPYAPMPSVPAVSPDRPTDAEKGGFRLLAFGRLLPYKGLDLLAACLRRLGPLPGVEVRVVGSGPESAALAALRALPGVAVENRWVPEQEVATLLGWADAMILPYREASQSGVAAVALAAGRQVIATNVGGLAEQLGHERLAILCEPDADSLAAGIRRALARPGATAAVASAQADARTAWQALGRVLVEQLQPLLRPRAAAPPLPGRAAAPVTPPPLVGRDAG
jgi:glycosyltransferase involved in cell wall biosynthesis